MNKYDLVESIASAAKISKTQANIAVNAFINTTTSSLKKGDSLTLVGFGTFRVVKRSARKGRNPQTGKAIKIAAKKVVRFRPGSELSSKVARAK